MKMPGKYLKLGHDRVIGMCTAFIWVKTGPGGELLWIYKGLEVGGDLLTSRMASLPQELFSMKLVKFWGKTTSNI